MLYGLTRMHYLVCCKGVVGCGGYTLKCDYLLTYVSKAYTYEECSSKDILIPLILRQASFKHEQLRKMLSS